MVFSSILFIFRFLPIAFLIYYLTPYRLKNFTILILSLFFYSWGEPKYFPIMIASILVDFIASRCIERFRSNKSLCISFLTLSIFFNMGMLFFFKYANFFIDNINAVTTLELTPIALTLPLGISFYTFQTLSYTIDVYLGKVKAERNIINFGAFVALFPQLIAGPIVKYTDINKALQSRTMNLAQIQDGVKLFILGLGSKVLIANNVGSLWTEVERLGLGSLSTPLAWLGLLAFGLQIYFDFSGYSLMAIGLGKMLGFDFPRNFNFPYISRSMTEFWRRWHITLGSWFREYLYIPLGGNRKGLGRTYINLLVVWAFTGFWHGASWNFVLWGLFFFVLISIEKAGLLRFLEHSKVFSRVYVIFFLLISWGLFAITDLNLLGEFLGNLFTFQEGISPIYYLRNYLVTLIIACVFATPIISNLFNKIKHKEWLSNLIYLSIFLLSVAYLVDATYNPFLYFRF
ncbi:MAG: MBOAT family O-acyltransferase [Cellulosilyticaceae bacterium]